MCLISFDKTDLEISFSGNLRLPEAGGGGQLYVGRGQVPGGVEEWRGQTQDGEGRGLQ